MRGLETVMGKFFFSKLEKHCFHDLRPGYVSGVGHYAEEDSVIVQVLYKCGAVPFVRTNVPQTLMVCNFSALFSIPVNNTGHDSGAKHTTTSSDAL